ncbi:hypothetical protein N7520_006094 [Penicillium odoratum]|uniref:uncharacterized protein n=1 Tax=Penicillium odoratum TaxID=1167516 RepID=UPI002547456A|nr:uncharacterized protein N7520_006094 [Penicillium odoratum]KAJ5758938.1 hypothetical protein N7520_006094 [Penicillium odoratum]
MNADVLHDILSLVQREVTQCLQPFDRHPEVVRATETYILDRLCALKGMWTKPIPGSPVASGAWAYQINRCAGCMLTRVTTQGRSLLLLRVALQSRTRTGRNHRPRRLMMFVDECINRFGREDAETIFAISSNLAYRMKATRKTCSRAHGKHSNRKRSDRAKQRSTGDSSEPSEKNPCNDGRHRGNGVCVSEETESSQQGAFSANADAEWAVRPGPRSSGSLYSPSSANTLDTERLGNAYFQAMPYEVFEMYKEFCEKTPFSYLGEDFEGNLAGESDDL